MGWWIWYKSNRYQLNKKVGRTWMKEILVKYDRGFNVNQASLD